MRERDVKSFFVGEPQPLATDTEKVGLLVAAGLEWGQYGELVGKRRRAVNNIARTILLNQSLLGIPMPLVISGPGSFENKSRETVNYLAFTTFVEGRPIIVLSKPFLKAHTEPDKYGNDMDLRDITINEVIAHECFHIKQEQETPWKLGQDTERANVTKSTWQTARSERAAKKYAQVFEGERTRLQRERNTLIFLRDMGIDPTGILDSVDQIAAAASDIPKT